MFVDKAKVYVVAGKGGNGALSFRHEKYVNKGGPDGGDGGRGGDIVLEADKNFNNLLHFRYHQKIEADHGQAGSKKRQNGKSGQDLAVRVPVGTTVMKKDQQLADLIHDGQKIIVAKGGKGGYGNAHFTSSTRQAPRIAEVGERGEESELNLELKLLADVGLIGLPNAGKSTFLSVITNARPEIADYPFTTLVPNLGVAEVDKQALLIADIPGLIKGAAEGKGLGGEFLRHIERTAVLVHMIDIYNNDIAKAYLTIRHELAAYKSTYQTDLLRKDEIVVLTKSEHLDSTTLELKKDVLRKTVGDHTPILTISSHTRQGLQELLRIVLRAVRKFRDSEKSQLISAKNSIPVIELSDKTKQLAWKVIKENDYFQVSGSKIERFASRTDFSNPDSVARLRNIMFKMGIIQELRRQDIEQGQLIFFARMDKTMIY